MPQPEPNVFRDEVLKGLEAQLRKQNQYLSEMLGLLRDQRDHSEELVKVMKDLRRVLTVKDSGVQEEMLKVLKEIRGELAR